MEEITIVGLDLAKHVFQVHAAKQDGTMLLRKKLARSKVLPFFASLPKCVVAMEACASATMRFVPVKSAAKQGA